MSERTQVPRARSFHLFPRGSPVFPRLTSQPWGGGKWQDGASGAGRGVLARSKAPKLAADAKWVYFLRFLTNKCRGMPARPTAAPARSPGLTSQPAAEFHTAVLLSIRRASPPCPSLQMDGCGAQASPGRVNAGSG